MREKRKKTVRNASVVLRPKTGLFDIDLAGVWKYRDLVWLFVRRDFVLRYKQTVLGPLWVLINPLVSSLVYTVVFGRLAGLSSDGTPQMLFYMAGNTIWSLFNSTVSANSNTFLANSGVFGKVYFPRLVAPVAQTITGLLNFCVFLAPMCLLMAYYAWQGQIILSNWLLLVPVLVLQTALLGLGVGIIFSSLTTKYRDLVNVVAFGLQMWMYASPVIYPLSSTAAGGRLRVLLMLNPMTPIIENFRFALFGSGQLQTGYWALSGAVTLICLFFGVIMFSRIEKTFIDTI